MVEFYQRDSYLRTLKTGVSDVMTMKKRPAVALAENLLYPEGGGQPCDRGAITLPSGARVEVARVLKLSGRVFAVLAEDATLAAGDEVTVEVDWPRRRRNMRYHTASHVLMAALAKRLVSYAPQGIEIAEDGSSSTIRFAGEWRGDREAAEAEIDAANRVIAEARACTVREFAALCDAIAEFGPLYRGPSEMKGPVSILLIDGWDANPCGGTHVRNTAEIGPLTLLDWSPSHVVFRLEV